MTDLVTFGESMLRFAPPPGERLETADEFDVAVAGAESNVAVAAQRLGLDACWTSRLPATPPARNLIGELRRHAVTVDVSWADEGRLGTYYLDVGESPRGNDVVYDRANAAVQSTTAEDLPMDRIEAARGFHVTGITPALSETLARTTEAVLTAANGATVTTSFDVNYRSKLWSPEAARDVLTDLLPAVDVLTVAERDARTVLEAEGNANDIATSLADQYDHEIVVLTRGADGALALVDGEVHEQPTYPAADRYPVGTGDAFVGGFLARYLDGDSVPTALEWGAATAALKRTIQGDVAVVTPAEVESVVRGDHAEISR